MLLAVAVVMLEVVPLGLEDMVVFVLDLPPAATGRDDLDHGLGRQRKGGRKGVAIQDLAVWVGGGQRAPIDLQRPVGVAQGNGLRKAIGVDLVALAGPACVHHGVDGAATLQMRDPVGHRGVRGRLADQDETQPQGRQGTAKRLVAVAIVAEHGRLQVAEVRAVPGQPALGGIDLAVLCLGTVLGSPERRGQRDDLVAAWPHQHRGHRRVDIRHLAVGVSARRTVFTVDARRRKILGPIQSEQQRVADRAVGIDHARLLQHTEEISIHRLHRAGWGRVEQVANVIVRGNLMGTEQGPGVIFPARLLQAALVLQKRGALHEEHREGAQPRIDHRVRRVLAPASVGEPRTGPAQLRRDVVQGQNVGAKGDAHQGVAVAIG